MDVNNKNYGADFRAGQSAAERLKKREKKSETAKENAKRGPQPYMARRPSDGERTTSLDEPERQARDERLDEALFLKASIQRYTR